MSKKRNKITTLEIILDALIQVLHKKGLVRREEIQLQILDDEEDE